MDQKWGVHLPLLLLVLLVPAWSHGVNSKVHWPVHSVRLLAEQRTEHYTITTNTSKFTVSGQIAEVSISGKKQPPQCSSKMTKSSSSSSNPCSSHLLALYQHPSDPRQVVPITFVNVSATNPAYPSTGSAKVRIKLLNFRTPGGFVFRLISNDTVQPVVLAESAAIPNTIPAAPGQVHLAQHADGSSIVVQWVSGSSTPQQLVYWANTASSSSSTSTSAGSKGAVQHANTKTGAGGSSSKASAAVVSSSVRSYSADMMCGPPATTFGFMHPGFMHTAVIPGADVGYGKQMHYRVGSDAAGWSSDHSFISSPRPTDVASGRVPFTFLVFNDVGQENAVLFDDVCPPYCPAGWQWSNYSGNSTKLAISLLKEEDARLGLLIGDLSYANGFQADWDYFGFQFEPAFSRWPLAVAPGNHETAPSGDVSGNPADAGGECNIPYTYRYYTPAWEAAGQFSLQKQPLVAPPANKPSMTPAAASHKQADRQSQHGQGAHAALPAATTQAQRQHKQQPQPSLIQEAGRLPAWLNPRKSYYSFNMGGVHFLMLDSETESSPGSPQGQFAAADLAKVDRSLTPWVVVGLHRQMVGPTTDAINLQNMRRLQSNYEDLYYKHKVDLVLQGHDHAYARMCPVYKGRCMPAPQTEPAAPAAARSKQPSSIVQTVHNPGAPIYILAGHAGAGFTHAFPKPLPEWVVYGVQDQNGYLRVTVSGNRLKAVSISTDDGRVMDGVEIVRDRAKS